MKRRPLLLVMDATRQTVRRVGSTDVEVPELVILGVLEDHRPLVILVDDIQDCDEASAAVLALHPCRIIGELRLAPP